MKNITVSVSDEIYRRARIRAAELGTSVSALVAEFLGCCEVSTVFGIVSVHNIPMLDAISRRGGRSI